MSYTVLWLNKAEAKLARIWNTAVDRAEVTKAADSIDIKLRANPGDCGESREDDLRVFFVPRLGVTFQIDEDDRVVRVADVWRFR